MCQTEVESSTCPPPARSPSWHLPLELLVASTCLFAVCDTIADPDLWGHLRFGLDMLRSGTIAAQDCYSYTSDRTWINHEWLAELVFAAIYQARRTAWPGRSQGGSRLIDSRDRLHSPAAGKAGSARPVFAVADGCPGRPSRPRRYSAAGVHLRDVSPGAHHPARPRMAGPPGSGGSCRSSLPGSTCTAASWRAWLWYWPG